MRVACLQMNPIVGDVAANGRMIREGLAAATAAGADVALTPELALSGFPPGDLLFDRDFLAEIERELAAVAATVGDLVALIGAPLCVDGLHNAVAVAHDGNIHTLYAQPRIGHDGPLGGTRYFVPGGSSSVVTIGGRRIEIAIGADPCVLDTAPSGGVDAVCWLMADPYRHAHPARREERVLAAAEKRRAPIVVCNLVGGQDQWVFDGRSFAVDAAGHALARAAEFNEQLMVVDLAPSAPRQTADRASPSPSPSSSLAAAGAWRGSEPRYSHASEQGTSVDATALSEPLGDEAALWAALTCSLGDYVRKNGAESVVLGLSGGIDSAVVAALAVDALGSRAVTGIALPSRYSSAESLAGAQALAAALAIDLLVIPIDGSVAAFEAALAHTVAPDPPSVTWENLQARARGTLLMAFSNATGALLLATGNKSELAVGYSTLYGDMAGGFAPLCDVTKTGVYRLAQWRNSIDGHDVIPQRTIDRAPTAELRPNQLDSDSLPPYAQLDPLLVDYIEHRMTVSELIHAGHPAELVQRVLTLVDRAEYKRRQGAVGPTVSARALGSDRKMPITARHVRKSA